MGEAGGINVKEKNEDESETSQACYVVVEWFWWHMMV
jgi:hypothetical protein